MGHIFVALAVWFAVSLVTGPAIGGWLGAHREASRVDPRRFAALN